jgi:two-component system sensor histidine kinase ChvG
VESIVENLLENAVSFTAPGGVIEVRLCRHGDLAQITVADRGPGVDPQNIARIFDRYVSYRPPAPMQADTSQTSGSHQGIGLWIVRRNVKGLGGTVEARNRAGGGFEVSVSLRTKL